MNGGRLRRAFQNHSRNSGRMSGDTGPRRQKLAATFASSLSSFLSSAFINAMEEECHGRLIPREQANKRASERASERGVYLPCKCLGYPKYQKKVTFAVSIESLVAAIIHSNIVGQIN